MDEQVLSVQQMRHPSQSHILDQLRPETPYRPSQRVDDGAEGDIQSVPAVRGEPRIQAMAGANTKGAPAPGRSAGCESAAENNAQGVGEGYDEYTA